MYLLTQVPEPATCALMLGDLGMMSAMLGRRCQGAGRD